MVKVMTLAGYSDCRQGGGGHYVMSAPDKNGAITIPKHDQLKRGTTRAIIRQADLTRETFLELYDQI